MLARKPTLTKGGVRRYKGYFGICQGAACVRIVSVRQTWLSYWILQQRAEGWERYVCLNAFLLQQDWTRLCSASPQPERVCLVLGGKPPLPDQVTWQPCPSPSLSWLDNLVAINRVSKITSIKLVVLVTKMARSQLCLAHFNYFLSWYHNTFSDVNLCEVMWSDEDWPQIFSPPFISGSDCREGPGWGGKDC